MEYYSSKYTSRTIFFLVSLVLFFTLKIDLLKAEDSYLNFEEMQIDSSTKNDESNSEFPSNPFEIVEMIRRANSMNNATNPSDALDEALDSFNNIEENKKLIQQINF